MNTKTHEYVNVNGIFIRKDFGIKKRQSKEQENTLTEGESERAKLDEEDIEDLNDMINNILVFVKIT